MTPINTSLRPSFDFKMPSSAHPPPPPHSAIYFLIMPLHPFHLSISIPVPPFLTPIWHSKITLVFVSNFSLLLLSFYLLVTPSSPPSSSHFYPLFIPSLSLSSSPFHPPFIPFSPPLHPLFIPFSPPLHPSSPPLHPLFIFFAPSFLVFL